MLKLQSIFLLRDGTGNGNDRVSATRQQAGFPENFEAVETKGTLLRSCDPVYCDVWMLLRSRSDDALDNWSLDDK